MECEKVKDEFFKAKFPPCCASCHEDDATGHGEDLWFTIEGKQRNVCCAVINAIVLFNLKSIK